MTKVRDKSTEAHPILVGSVWHTLHDWKFKDFWIFAEPSGNSKEFNDKMENLNGRGGGGGGLTVIEVWGQGGKGEGLKYGRGPWYVWYGCFLELPNSTFWAIYIIWYNMINRQKYLHLQVVNLQVVNNSVPIVDAYSSECVLAFVNKLTGRRLRGMCWCKEELCWMVLESWAVYQQQMWAG